jgi:hypothetical protein
VWEEKLRVAAKGRLRLKQQSMCVNLKDFGVFYVMKFLRLESMK